MTKNALIAVVASLVITAGAAWLAAPASARAPIAHYQVLDPIQHGKLMIFPVVAANTHDTTQFLTLDEGLRSGEVVVTESGNVPAPLIRRRDTPLPRHDGAQVNRLVLINNSDRPLILLAGEIVTGGKQDRVIGRPRIVPAKSDPVDLSVFCVEPGRWTGASDKFGGLSAQMAQPSVRSKAMAERNQQQVWDAVRSSSAAMVAAAPRAAAEMGGSTSYAKAAASPTIQKQVDEVAEPIRKSYESLLRQLHDRHAVGVVVAVNGELQWADIFAGEQLLQKYWPKLVRSYAAESLTTSTAYHKAPTTDDAQQFASGLWGEHEISETEPDVFRETEVQGDGYRVFRLTSLLPKTGFDVHVAKMTTGESVSPVMVR